MFPLRDNIPTDRAPIVTVALILANVLVYFLWQRGGWSGIDVGQLQDYAVVPCHLAATACDQPAARQPDVWLTPLTAMFMHGNLLHLGGNMLFLWIFGNNVEDAMGRVRFVAFYLLGGLAATAAQVAINAGSGVPNLGASGAVAAVLGGYLLLYPRARVLTFIFVIFFFTVIELPALLVLGLWIAEQAWLGANGVLHGGEEGGGVAYFAHIGGFAFGLLAIRLFARRVKQVPARRPAF